MEFLLALTTLSLLPLCAHAHMQMSNPYPINSPLNPATPESLKDYSYTSPLLADGSNFPCKGYQTQSTSYNTTATYTAGSTYSMSITGATNHGGGSCQLSLSYDNGQTFKVIESMIGGCPITTTYNFTIPSFAPSSQSALFAWSWFNEMGNREMYMDCARVEIQAVSPGRRRRAQYKRQASLSSLPDLFVCNVNNGCTTIERENVQFPDPGANVIYGADDSAYLPLNGTGFTGSGYASNNTANATMPSATTTSGPDANTTSTIASLFFPNTTTSLLLSSSQTTTSAAAAAIQSTSTLILVDVFTVATTLLVNRTPSSFLVSATNVSSSAVMPMATVLTTTGSSATSSSYQPIFSNTTSSGTPPSPSSQLPPFFNTTLVLSSQLTNLPASTMTVPTSNSTFVTVTSTSASASASATLLTGPCISGAFACNSASTFSQCVAGLGGTSSYTYMGSVAAGMACTNGQIIRQNDGPCTPNGQLFCNGEYAFYTCDQGGLVNMGPVAPGTACVNGVIGYLRPRM